MVRDALTGYWTLVSGLTEVTVDRARAAARSMLAQGEATREQVTGLAQEITEASRTNREALLKLVRYEAERAAARLGFASTDEVTTLQGRVRELERSIGELRAAADASVPATAADRPVARPADRDTQPGAAEPAAPAPPKKAAAKKAGKKAAGKRAPAKAVETTRTAKATKATKATKTTEPSKAAKPAEATEATEASKATKTTEATQAAKAPVKAAGEKAPAKKAPPAGSGA